VFAKKWRAGDFRIGVLYPKMNGWLGGAKYVRMLIGSLAGVRAGADPELYVLSEEENLTEDFARKVTVLPVEAPHYRRGEMRLRRLCGLSDKSALLSTARQHQISVLLPVQTPLPPAADLQTIGWIPDFQHLFLPQFFSREMREYRDQAFRLLARQCALVMLSSRNAVEHFVRFAPEQAHKARLLSFPSRFAFEPPPAKIVDARQKFRIPEKFALVVNQFWRHKNHEVVIEAVRLLWSRGIRLHLVLVGVPADYRDSRNETTSRLLQSVAMAGIAQTTTILGMVTDAELTDLLRSAAVIVQPSRFEGWSTVVQECKALGRPLICSDIPIHREQAPDALGFFPCERPDVLADLLSATWPDLNPGPDAAAERKALAAEREFGRCHGQALLKICEEAHAVRQP